MRRRSAPPTLLAWVGRPPHVVAWPRRRLLTDGFAFIAVRLTKTATGSHRDGVTDSRRSTQTGSPPCHSPI